MRKRRKRPYDVENLAFKFGLMRLPAFGNHVNSSNQGFLSEQDREPWQRGCFSETRRLDWRLILFYCSDTTRSCRPVPLWLQNYLDKTVSYSLDSMHTKAKGVLNWLKVSSELFFLIPYFTSYIDINCFLLRQMCFSGHLMTICKDTN